VFSLIYALLSYSVGNVLFIHGYRTVLQAHQLDAWFPSCGDDGTRTRDFRLAKAALSQLSYIPKNIPGVVGLTGFEPVTPALSAQCSNQLSYRPMYC
jgi:hypothetical protein